MQDEAENREQGAEGPPHGASGRLPEKPARFLCMCFFFISEMPQMETVFQKEGAHEKGGCFARRHATQPPRTGASRSTRIRNEVIAEGPSGSHVPCVFVGRRRLRAGAPSSTLLPPASDPKRGTFPHTGGAGASSLRPVGENNAKLRRSELPTDTPSPAPVLRRPP